MHRTARLLTSIALAVPLALAATGAAAQSPTPVPVLDIDWTVSSLDGERIPEDAGITANFHTDGTLTGDGGCNTYNATWTSDGVVLTVTDLATTRMACEDAVSQREALYFDLLQDASGWSLDGVVLTVTTASGASIVYGDDAQATEGIAGTWTLASIDGESVPVGVTAFATFGADGSLTGNGGCNSFSSHYITDGSSITVAPIAATLKLCEGSSETERQFLDALQGATTWSTTGGGLVLDGAGELVFTGEGGTAGEATLTGQEWFVARLDGEAFDPTLGASATFGDDGSLTGFGGCNRFMGSYTADDSSLRVDPLASTRMACAPHIMDAEARYLSALQAAMSYTIVGDTMFVETIGAGDIELATQRDPAPAPTATPDPTPAATQGATGDTLFGSWQLSTYAGTTIPGYEFLIDITFFEDGTFAGFAGCNDYSGQWSFDGTKLGISGVDAASSGTCDTIASGFEQGFLALLPFIDTVAFGSDGSLSLTSSLGGGQGFGFVPAD